jgi:glutaminyl-tRNA synthetase
MLRTAVYLLLRALSCHVMLLQPEPNGYLHIGHAKAMFVNFGQAKMQGGECLLRFDDTNPTAEKQEYIDAIIENLNWLGHEPVKITYSSDYFGKLLELVSTNRVL